MILPSCHRIRSQDLGRLRPTVTDLAVRSVRVGLLPTGSSWCRRVWCRRPGGLWRATPSCAAALEEAGAEASLRIVPDDYDLIRAAVRCGVVENDILLVSAGSSAGTGIHR